MAWNVYYHNNNNNHQHAHECITAACTDAFSVVVETTSLESESTPRPESRVWVKTESIESRVRDQRRSSPSRDQWGLIT